MTDEQTQEPVADASAAPQEGASTSTAPEVAQTETAAAGPAADPADTQETVAEAAAEFDEPEPEHPHHHGFNPNAHRGVAAGPAPHPRTV